MLTDNYVNSASSVFANNRLLYFLVIMLTGMQVYTYVYIQNMVEQQKTVLIPVGLSETVTVDSTSLDDSYLDAMSMYVASLLYSTTPSSVEKQYSMLIELLSPDAYAKYSEALLLSAVQQNKNQVTYTSKVEEIVIQTEPIKQITVELISNKYVFSELVEPKVRNTITIGYEVRHGRFLINSLELQGK